MLIYNASLPPAHSGNSDVMAQLSHRALKSCQFGYQIAMIVIDRASRGLDPFPGTESRLAWQ